MKKLLAIAFAAVALNVQAAELVVFTRSTWGICQGYGYRVYYIANPKHKDAISVARAIDPTITFAYWQKPGTKPSIRLEPATNRGVLAPLL